MTHLERWRSWHSCSSRYTRPSEHSTASSRLLQCARTWTDIQNNPASWCRELGVPRYRRLHPSRHPSERHSYSCIQCIPNMSRNFLFMSQYRIKKVFALILFSAPFPSLSVAEFKTEPTLFFIIRIEQKHKQTLRCRVRKCSYLFFGSCCCLIQCGNPAEIRKKNTQWTSSVKWVYNTHDITSPSPYLSSMRYTLYDMRNEKYD